MKIFGFPTICLLLLLCTSCTPSAQEATSSELNLSDQTISQLLLVGFRGFTLEDTSQIARQLKEGKAGGIILFSRDVVLKSKDRNIASPEQVKTLIQKAQALSPSTLLVAIDQEGGRVARLRPERGFHPTVSAQYLGNLDNLDSTRHYADINSKALKELGFNLNFAPVVDVNVNPESPAIGKIERSFSADPEKVIQHAEQYVESQRAHGIISVLKHFPGHGSADLDSHYSPIVDVTGTWSEKELLPYAELIKKGKCDAIMTAHVFNASIDPEYPSTLSEKALAILRDSYQFDGVIFSDDMHMNAITERYGFEEAILRSINAGVDMIVLGNNLGYDPAIPDKFITIIRKGIADGKLSEERVLEAAERVRNLKRKTKN